tara:strand:+ start:3566 stop:4573 length:1008 start_codon:yes stop_codon:yes gene_type:complete
MIKNTSLKNKKILITGGAGFIGSELTKQVLSHEAKVLVVDSLVNGKKSNLNMDDKNLIFYEEDIRNQSIMQNLISESDYIFNLACLGVRHSIHSPIESHSVNADATLNLLKISRESEIKKFIHISTSEVYGSAKYVPMTEEHPTIPHTVYGASKLAGEAYARAYSKSFDTNTVIIRPFNSYGYNSHHEGDSGEVIPKFVIRALTGNPLYIFGDGEQTRDFTFVTDTAKAIIQIGLNDLNNETYNLGSENEITINELAKLILKLTDSSSEIIHIDPRPGDVKRLFSDSSKAFTEFKLSHEINFETGLKNLILHYKKSDIDLNEMLNEDIVKNWELQ